MLVMKFGGAAVATAESFLHIAKIIMQKNDPQIVVVVSAMGNTTDQLISLAKQVNPNPPARELDMMVSVGERVSVALLAMALAKLSKEAVSFTGSQSGIITCENHTDAKILEVKPHRLEKTLSQNKIAIVAGFQGVSRSGEITTLGRGGSDTTAVALGISLGANRVEFYKDVAGIYDSDPKKSASCHLLPYLSYEDASKIIQKGAKVLHNRSILLAQKNGIELAIHSFHDPHTVGTLVGTAQRTKKVVYEGDDV